MSRNEASKISVVVTTYNRATKLPATLDSILAQTVRDFELIISDDCSSDDTPAVCHEYAQRDSRIRYVRNPTNLAMPGNLNAAIAQARGDYIANLHDDDIYRPDLLQKWAAALDRHPNAALVFNQYDIIDHRGRRRIDKVDMPECMPGREFLRRFFITQWGSPIFGTVMARRSCYEAVGPFDPRFWMHSDVDMWVRLAIRYDIAYVQEPLITVMPREADHVLTKHVLWELTLDPRIKRSTVGILYPKSSLRRLHFEIRARAYYLRYAIAALRHARWRHVAFGLYVAITGRDEMNPPR